MNKKYPKQFKRVSDYLKEKFGINVLLGQMTAFMGHKNKKIFIHHNHNLEKNGLYSLLHEVGHVLQNDKDNLFKTIDEDMYPRKFKFYQYINELNAWERGLLFANEFGIEVNIKDWVKIQKESLLTYSKKIYLESI
tara:strand:+ start:1251 stop:1658 length:408 start_codon:yes stop_codon:yes gene_type:complete